MSHDASLSSRLSGKFISPGLCIQRTRQYDADVSTQQPSGSFNVLSNIAHADRHPPTQPCGPGVARLLEPLPCGVRGKAPAPLWRMHVP